MTEYSYGGKTLTELSGLDYSERSAYFEQALKAYRQSPYDMTFLPIGKNAIPDIINFYIIDDYESSGNTRQEAAYKHILQKTLETTFAKGDTTLNSRLIATLGQSYDGTGSKEQKNQDAYRDIVLSAVKTFSNDDQWFNSLDSAAKITLLDIGLEKDPYLVQQLQNTIFQIPEQKNSEYYILSRQSEQLLAKDMKHNPNERREVLPWETKAELLNVHAQTNGKNNLMLPVFANLLKTIENHGDTAIPRSERVTKLISLAEKISESFDFQHNYYAQNERSVIPSDWAELVPVCDEAQKLFYTCLYKMHFSEPHNFPRNSLNAAAFQSAKEEVAAQQALDDLSKYKRDGLSSKEMLLLIRFRPQELIAYKHFSPETQLNLLQNPDLKIPESKRLSMMSQYIAAAQQKNDRIADQNLTFLLDSALKMKTVSPEMKKFIQAAEPLVEMQAAQYNVRKEKLKQILQKQKQLDYANEEVQKYVKAQAAMNSLAVFAQDIARLRTDKELQLSEAELEKVVRNAISGKEPKQIKYTKQGSLSSLFSGKKEKERQQEAEKQIHKFNAFLPELAQHKDIFNQIDLSLISREGFEAFNILYKEAEDQQKNADNAYRLTDSFALDAYKSFIQEYENNNPKEKLAQISEGLNCRTKELQTKARENLSLAFKGQEFSGRSVFAEQEKSVRRTYKKKAEELRKRLKDAAKEEMADRGIYEKPALEDDGKNSKKISRKTSDKVLKIMKDKKLYDQLSKK